MNIELARDLVRSAFLTSADLQKMLPAIKANCSEEEYRELARGIAQAIDSVWVALTSKALATYPQLTAEIDARIASDGRYD